MPGYSILDSQIKGNSSENISKYRCPACRLLLRDSVQPSCGHWLCHGCAEEIFANKSPRCPRDDCGEELVPEDGQNFFPDRFVRREILAFIVTCCYALYGCLWEGPLSEYEKHKEECKFAQEVCGCGKTMPRSELALHKKKSCPNSKKHCPLSKMGCSNNQEMTHAELMKHFGDTNDVISHFEMVADMLKKMQIDVKDMPLAVASKRPPAIGSERSNDSGLNSLSGSLSFGKDIVERDNPQPRSADFVKVPVFTADTRLGPPLPMGSWMPEAMEKLRRYEEELETRDKKIKALEQQVSQIQKTLQTKNTEIEDRDFRLSLIENSNYDGTMVWKIPQFSQRMTDAKTGKYTSIFSLPFYSSRYGYKMCLRLYIMGDGIGKGSHMSLFFVIMRGEFDSILPWPFTHRVTFRLINQGTSGRDIVDTFQPDPLSSSFKKPKSDMNIASGCPRFISHENLKGGGYIVDDTIFVKCVVDRSTMAHP